MMGDEDPISKTNLMQRIRESRAALEELIAPLSEAQLEARQGEGWAIKDHLAHITVWERGIARLLQGEPRYEAMGVDALVRQGEHMDVLNEHIYQQHAALAGTEVLQMFRDAHRELLAALAGLSDEDLLRPYATYAVHDEPQPDSAGKDPIVGWIAGNTFGHYDEHAGYMRDSLAKGL
jgi:uncharacterized protein (TIGR03083 family)